jgi:hypothetical protein
MAQITEPVLTWNLFLTAFFIPLCLLLLWGAIKRQFKERDKKDEKIAALLEEREEVKESAIHEWRDRFDKNLCAVKLTVEGIREEMHTKVTFSICDDREREMKQSLSDHDRRMRAGGI